MAGRASGIKMGDVGGGSLISEGVASSRVVGGLPLLSSLVP